MSINEKNVHGKNVKEEQRPHRGGKMWIKKGHRSLLKWSTFRVALCLKMLKIAKIL